MTLIELLSLLLICLVVGFAAHLIFPAWGWWLGATPALTLMFVLAFFTFKNLFSSADENGHGNMVGENGDASSRD